MINIFWLIFGLFFFWGCHDQASDNQLSQNDVIAMIDERPVLKKEFNAFLKFKRIVQKDSEPQKQHFTHYLHREALADAIEKANLLDRDQIKAELNEFRKEMLISRYFEQYLNNQVTEADIQKYYQEHAKDFDDQKAHAAHILFRTHKKMSETEKKAILTTAHEVFSKIRAGKDFADMASQYSEDRISAKKGGNLGWVKAGSIDKQFSETLFSLKPNEVSSPIETQFGYHIVKLLDKVRTVRQPLEAVAGDIRYQLRRQEKEKEMARLMSTMRIREL
jgi:peptidyl-prolyl cis-trans isomerase C